MPFDIGAVGMSAANTAIGTGLGLLLEKHNDRRQLRQQDRLNNQNEQMSKRLAEFNYEQQMKMWNATNYKAQKEQMKAAGLSPGMLYGMSGGGGSTTAAAQASTPSGGGAPSGGGEIMGITGQAMQMSLLKAQKENIEADTKSKLANVSNTETDTIGKGIVNELNQMELEMNTETYEARKWRIKYETNEALARLQLTQNAGIVAENTTMDRIAMVGAELVGMEIRNELSRVQKDKTFSDIEVNKAQIQNFLVQNAQGWQKLSLEERNVKVNELLGEFNTSLSREALGAVGGIISTILSRGLTKAAKKTNIVINRHPE